MRVIPFFIRISVDRNIVRLKVTQQNLTDSFEEFAVKAKNGTLVFKSNRPLLRGKGLKKRDPDLTLVTGQIKSSYENAIKDVIIDYLNDYENKHFPVKFEHSGKLFSGHLSKVSGAGGDNIWDLMGDDHYCYGRLRMAMGKWVFDDSKKENQFYLLASLFACIVTGEMGL